MQAPKQRAAFVFIFITVLLDMLALGMIIPVLPKLVESFMGGDTRQAAWMFGLFGTAFALMQFLFSPVLGAVSDRFGRRPVVLLSNLGNGIDYLLMALAPTLLLLFVGRIISGITAASISTAFAYIADVTPPEKRSRSFGLLGAAFGAGFVLGPAIGGLLSVFGPRTPFWVAAAFSLANALYGYLILPESLSRENRAPFRWAKANPIGSLGLLRAHPGLLGLASSNFLYHLAHNVLQSTFVLYASYRYGWDEATVGLTLAGVGVCAAVVQAGLVGPVVARFGDRKALLAGFLFGAVGFSIYGLAPTPVWFWAGIPLMALWGLASPALQGLMSQRVSGSEQGRLQGANNSLAGIANLIGPTIFSEISALSLGGVLPGAAFLVSALCLLLAAVIGARATAGV